MLKIGINGFGRIGKMFFRLSLLENDIKVVAINDLISIEDLYHSMKYDSVHGNIKHDIKLKENIEQVDNRINNSLIKILFFAFGEKNYLNYFY